MSCKFPVDAETDYYNLGNLKQLRDYLTVKEVRKSKSVSPSQGIGRAMSL